MEVKEGFKKTEIGVFPNDWELTTLENVAFVTGGGTPSTIIKDFWNGEINWFTPTEIGLKKYSFESLRKITKKGLENSSAKMLPVGTVLLTSRAGIGDVSILMEEGCTNQGFQSLIAKENIYNEFLYYLVSTLKNTFIKNASGSTFLEISPQKVKSVEIVIPSLPEQTAIATALSDTDALIESLEKLIEKKRNIKQGVMQELLTGKKRLDGFDGEWEIIKLGDIGKTHGGLSGKSKKDFEGGMFPYIPFLNIMNNPVIDCKHFDFVNIQAGEIQNKAKKGDLFFNGSSETPEEVGMCSVLLDDIPNLYLNSFCFILRINNQEEYDGLFLTYYFRSNEGRKLIYSLAQGATRYNLSKNNFLKIMLRIPHYREQKAIARVLSDIENELESLEQKLNKYKMIKQGMMQVLLTGKIRLV